MSRPCEDLSAQIAARGRKRSYAAGDPLFLQGDRSDQVILISAGSVRITAVTDTGETTMLAACGPGDVIGELSVIDGGPRSASAYAVVDVVARVVSASEFEEILRSHPELMLEQLRTLVARLRDSDEKRLEMASVGTDARLARRLVELASTHSEEVEDGVVITLPLSQEELASWVGASREAVARSLKRLRDAGIVATQRRELRILDLAALEKRAMC